MTQETGALAALSNDIAAAVERVAAGVVAVEGRSRVGSSGFYIRPNLIVTADHALESDEVEIVRADGKSETAVVAGRDSSTDIALLRTESGGTPLRFAASDALRVGALALAVARDDDGDVAASMGVLSAVSGAWRTWHGGEIEHFVRPDLSLYARFSGSPLADAAGAILGMNTGGLSRRQDLTVPAVTIERVVEGLLRGGGRLPRGYLGVHLQPILSGIIILAVEQDSPAAQGGLLVGDVITTMDGAAAGDVADVHARLGSASVGQKIALGIVRAGVPRTVDVALGSRPAGDQE